MSVAKTSGYPARRKPGRKPRISREKIIQTSLEMLQRTRVEDFMLKNLSRELGTAPMAIYNYFSSRDELLVAVADEVCLLFSPPEPRGTWQEILLAWLWAIKEHADRYPVLPSIIGINGYASAGWVRITQPITILLHRELRLTGKSLAMATFLFATTAASMIRVLKSSPDYTRDPVFSKSAETAGDAELDPVIKRTRIALAELNENELFSAHFAQLIKGIEVFLQDGSP